MPARKARHAASDHLIVYYSRTGTTRQAAEMLASATGWELAEIKDVRSRTGWLGDLRCVVDNVLRRRSAYRYYGPSPATCRAVVVLAPVWVGHVAAPMRSFLQDQAPFPARLAAVCVMAARGGFNATEEIASASGKLPRPALVILQRELANGEARQDLMEFVTDLRANELAEDGGMLPRPAWLSPHEA